LNRKIHETYPEYGDYAIGLMDKLENYKAENATNDAVVDDVAAQAYIENFALETFRRAEEAQNSDRVTRQTIDIFQASTTFIDLLSIWGPLDVELVAKSKFAKYHALRIAKAISKGEDPNLTNPRVEPPPQLADAGTTEELAAELDAETETSAGATYQAPTVETVADDEAGFILPSAPTTVGPSSQFARGPTVDDDFEHVSAAPTTRRDDVSPIQTAQDPTMRDYFPTPTSHVPPTIAPTLAAPVPLPHPATARAPASHIPQVIPPGLTTPSLVSAPAAPPPAVAASHQPPTGFNLDDDSIAAAQKHAKWAISALQFEDVNTAVAELRIALKSLGGL
jgi:vacuolar protein sorting-associated protein VTA1